MEDHNIIDLYWERSEQAVSETEKKYGRYCHGISYGILRSHEDAEECVNETYFRAWNAMPPQRPNSLRAFLGRIARNLSLNRYQAANAQKRGRGQTELVLEELAECLAAPEDVEHTVEMAELVRCINDFLRALPERKRNIFLLRYWYLCPVSEIARQYGMRENNVSLHLHRMRGALRKYLEKGGIIL